MLTTAWSTPKRNIDSYRFVKFCASDFKVLEREGSTVGILQNQNSGGQQVNITYCPFFVSLNPGIACDALSSF